ncbi:hypothetical protein NIES2100_01280 [Calothrix sp. NIES-2100]|uniref:hypothetical protein n=1 Tax=Calothrix sp. NIES-2100 TaxID=1954172 RepID=UPI000B60B45D|nr:hypothetical protein NIES2100_01280 [Calothrix sp. NIES-2100]
MFGLSELKQTRVYQEAKQEGIEEANLKAISGMLMLGLTVEQIAQVLNLEAAQVEQSAHKQNYQNDELRGDSKSD